MTTFNFPSVPQCIQMTDIILNFPMGRKTKWRPFPSVENYNGSSSYDDCKMKPKTPWQLDLL